jgi:hypothetical protein
MPIFDDDEHRASKRSALPSKASSALDMTYIMRAAIAAIEIDSSLHLHAVFQDIVGES